MVKIQTKNNGEVRMSLSEFARWACLIEAFMFINDKASELGVNPIDMIKPLAVEEYIKERYEAMYHDVGVEYSMGNI
jgi:hypothetical protein